MAQFRIVHETRYSYERAVTFGPQRLMLRPRDSHASRLVDASLSLSPPGATRWTYDAFGNCVCWFTPQGPAQRLIITSHLTIARFPAPLSEPEADDPQSAMPLIYGGEDRVALAPYMSPATDDEQPQFLHWLRGRVGRSEEPALDFLLRLNSAIHEGFDYKARAAEGVQTPHETLATGSGTCRDFAWLMVEGLRRLGFAARFVSGYLYSPKLEGGLRGAGATHAWCEVFLPDLGWTEFDPTNGLAESPDLIPVAVARTPTQAAPVSGTILGDPGQVSLHVDVKVTHETPLPEAA
jgi:YD repeat-containing protein